jgi:hypothetical protein
MGMEPRQKEPLPAPLSRYYYLLLVLLLAATDCYSDLAARLVLYAWSYLYRARSGISVIYLTVVHRSQRHT